MIPNCPTLDEIKKNRQRIYQWIVNTPVWQYRNETLQKYVEPNTQLFFKLELFQKTGSFKARGAITTLLHLNAEQLKRGVVAATAGNHGIAVAYAANAFSTSAKIIMPRTASPIRIERAISYGAEVILVESFKGAVARMQEIAQTENRIGIHPYEGPYITMGTGSIGLELAEQVSDADAIIVPTGGGGLCSGIAVVIKQLLPKCQIIGVEPTGAATIYNSRIAGKPITLESVDTIAESLTPSQAMPFSFSLCQKYIDDIVLVDDLAMRKSMLLLFNEMKFAVEPSAAAALSALTGPLQERLAGKKVVLMVSGSNIDASRYCEYVNDLRLVTKI